MDKTNSKLEFLYLEGFALDYHGTNKDINFSFRMYFRGSK